jgi:LysM repeat protein
LGEIASRFSVTVEALAQANGITDLDHIEEGQVLVIPGA